jgi:hypothetical protein
MPSCAMAPDTENKKDPRAWDALNPPLAEWTLDAIATMGFGRMTPVQASTIPLFILGNKDVVVEVLLPKVHKRDILMCSRQLLVVERPWLS